MKRTYRVTEPKIEVKNIRENVETEYEGTYVSRLDNAEKILAQPSVFRSAYDDEETFKNENEKIIDKTELCQQMPREIIEASKRFVTSFLSFAYCVAIPISVYFDLICSIHLNVFISLIIINMIFSITKLCLKILNLKHFFIVNIAGIIVNLCFFLAYLIFSMIYYIKRLCLASLFMFGLTCLVLFITKNLKLTHKKECIYLILTYFFFLITVLFQMLCYKNYITNVCYLLSMIGYFITQFFDKKFGLFAFSLDVINVVLIYSICFLIEISSGVVEPFALDRMVFENF